MIRDVTLGRYYRQDSFLHTLDPRTKLCGVVFLIAGIFISSSVVTCIFTMLCIAALVWLSRVPLRYMVRGLLSIFVFLTIVAVLNIILVPNGVFRAILISLRVVEVIFASNLLCLSTRPREISNGVETGFSWMSHLKVPVHDLATIVSIAFTFIPILAEEARRILDAQTSRGLDMRKGGLVKKAKASVSVIIPMFVSAMERAENLAVAMESRLYGCGEPTRLHPLKYSYDDAAAYVCIFTYLLVVILMKVGRL